MNTIYVKEDTKRCPCQNQAVQFITTNKYDYSTDVLPDF